MTDSIRFADIHILQTVPFANLNRDDLGAPKEVTFGDATRMRVSSQCYKRATREMLQDLTSGDGWDFGTRSRAHGETIAAALQERGWPRTTAHIAARDLFAMLDEDRDDQDEETEDDTKTTKAKTKTKARATTGEDEASRLMTNVLLYLNNSDIPRLVELAEAHREEYQRAADNAPAEGPLPTVHAAKDKKWQKELVTVLKQCTGAGLALFGRMIAALPEGRIDGASQVAHAFTTHQAKFEVDYFTAVDDLTTGKENSGSGHLGNAEFASGVFYRYATLDLAELRSNLTGPNAQEQTAELASLFLQAFALATPSGKKTSTAPYTPPALVYVALRSDRPVSLAAAFEAPVRAGEKGHLTVSLDRLYEHLNQLEAFFGEEGRIWHAHAASVDTTRGDDEEAAWGKRLSMPKLRDAITSHLTSGNR